MLWPSPDLREAYRRRGKVCTVYSRLDHRYALSIVPVFTRVALPVLIPFSGVPYPACPHCQMPEIAKGPLRRVFSGEVPKLIVAKPFVSHVVEGRWIKLEIELARVHPARERSGKLSCIF